MTSKNFLYNGDIWNSILDIDSNPDAFGNIVSTAIKNGKLEFRASKGDKSFAFLKHMNTDNSAGIISAILMKDRGEANEFYSIHPIFDGISATADIKDIYYADELAASYITITLTDIDFMPITLFVPNFLATGSNKGDNISIKLSALAINIEKSPDKPLKISSGPFYEMQLKEFLSNNPDKTSKDYPFVEVFINKAHTLIPTDMEDCYEFQADILDVKEVDFFGTNMYQLKINPIFSTDKEKEIDIYLYATKSVLDNYKPQKGDNIRGNLAMFGNTDNLI